MYRIEKKEKKQENHIIKCELLLKSSFHPNVNKNIEDMHMALSINI
jgi:hypothetical protein